MDGSGDGGLPPVALSYDYFKKVTVRRLQIRSLNSVLRIYFFLILHPIPLRLGVPNALPSLSVVVSILKFEVRQP